MYASKFARLYLPILCVALFIVMLSRVRSNPRGIIWADAEGYYKYLPTVFIIGDVHQMPEGSVWPSKNERGEILNKFTCGVAYLEAPFFFAARMYNKHFDLDPENGFNDRYAFSVAVAGWFYTCVGLFFLQLSLRRRFRESVVGLTLVAILLGTNLFHYAVKESGMSHVYSFCLISVLLWHIPRFYRAPTAIRAVILGGLLGWIALIRPSNLVLVGLVLFYDVYTQMEVRERLRFWISHFGSVLVMLVAGILFWLPQMVYWHEMTGTWFRYSYTGEAFIYWKTPHLAAVLFDPQNGLFLYSPIVLFMVLGIMNSIRKRSDSGAVLGVLFIIFTYIFASWWCWWFGGAFGARSYIELYPLFAAPLAGLLEAMLLVRSKIRRGIFWLFFMLFLAYSVRMSYLYYTLPRPWDGQDWRWNWSKMGWVWSHLLRDP